MLFSLIGNRRNIINAWALSMHTDTHMYMHMHARTHTHRHAHTDHFWALVNCCSTWFIVNTVTEIQAVSSCFVSVDEWFRSGFEEYMAMLLFKHIMTRAKLSGGQSKQLFKKWTKIAHASGKERPKMWEWKKNAQHAHGNDYFLKSKTDGLAMKL